MHHLTRILTRGIPDLSAEVVGFFRVFYAAFLFVALDQHRLVITDAFVSGDDSLRWDWVLAIIARPSLVAFLEQLLLGLLIVFAIGLFTRTVYWLFAAGFTVWLLVMLQSGTNIHEWEVSFFTILCLLPVPWGAGFSVDAWRRRRRGAPQERLHGKHFGYAVWMPGFILGAIWASAAYSKVEGGLDWILGGAVKYHWVIDSPAAPVDWGLWVASHPRVAVLMSFLGVALEATFIIACFVRSTRARSLIATFIGTALIAGFFVFHGVLWWTWGLVLVSFVMPWEWLYNTVVGRFASHQASELTSVNWPLRRAHGVCVLIICLLMIKQWPVEGIGRFTSYSNTYESTADFDQRNPIKEVNRLLVAYNTLGEMQVFQGTSHGDLIVDAMLLLSRHEELPESYRSQLPQLGRRLSDEFGYERAQVTLVQERKAFDWNRGRYVVASNTVVGTIDLNSLEFHANQ